MRTTLRGPSGPFTADVTVPGDKSLSHRALILAAMARGTSSVTGLGPGRDVDSTRSAIMSLGVEVQDGLVRSAGVDAWSDPGEPIDAGNSGTTLRLLAGALAGRPFRSTLVGDESLMRRPMGRLVGPLGALGARVETSDEATPPVSVGGDRLAGADVTIPIASAQVRSAVALAALQADGATTIDSPPGFRDHTERWLETLGRGSREEGHRFRVEPGPVPPADYAVPGDPSSAAYLLATAALAPGAEVVVRRISLNPGRTGFLDVLAAMGVDVAIEATGDVLGDPVGDVRVRGAKLEGVRIDGHLVARTLDEIPLLAVLAAAAEGDTVIADATELRVKESDRVETTVAMLRALGGEAEETPDGFVVAGGFLKPGTVDSEGDHRIALAAAVAATVAGQVEIEGFDASAVSWPGFVEELEAVWSS
ncbi:MAG: 3-phosphoshikimate 1-carboxyvinyltransferase [Acidimicrobiia bacterium]|nr:3-phosphoshikimate 1-carboxyvinyltransferase [Acidimicrobiia bacterium]